MSWGSCCLWLVELADISQHGPHTSAFWLLVSIVTNYLKDYYTLSMRGFRVDAFILGKLLKTSEPKLHKKLQEQGIEGMRL